MIIPNNAAEKITLPIGYKYSSHTANTTNCKQQTSQLFVPTVIQQFFTALFIIPLPVSKNSNKEKKQYVFTSE